MLLHCSCQALNGRELIFLQSDSSLRLQTICQSYTICSWTSYCTTKRSLKSPTTHGSSSSRFLSSSWGIRRWLKSIWKASICSGMGAWTSSKRLLLRLLLPQKKEINRVRSPNFWAGRSSCTVLIRRHSCKAFFAPEPDVTEIGKVITTPPTTDPFSNSLLDRAKKTATKPFFSNFKLPSSRSQKRTRNFYVSQIPDANDWATSDNEDGKYAENEDKDIQRPQKKSRPKVSRHKERLLENSVLESAAAFMFSTSGP